MHGGLSAFQGRTPRIRYAGTVHAILLSVSASLFALAFAIAAAFCAFMAYQSFRHGAYDWRGRRRIP